MEAGQPQRDKYSPHSQDMVVLLGYHSQSSLSGEGLGVTAIF